MIKVLLLAIVLEKNPLNQPIVVMNESGNRGFTQKDLTVHQLLSISYSMQVSLAWLTRLVKLM